jgi:hypothetical protein
MNNKRGLAVILFVLCVTGCSTELNYYKLNINPFENKSLLKLEYIGSNLNKRLKKAGEIDESKSDLVQKNYTNFIVENEYY